MRQSADGMAFFSAWCWREKVAQWCYDVIDHLGEKRQLAYVAMNILDRFTNHRTTDERRYEIEAMSALFLAVRVAGTGNLSLPQLITMSREEITAKEIIATGKLMISELDWDHHLLTPADFVHALIRDNLSSRLTETVQLSLLDSALYLAELSVFDFVLASKRPSVVGAAAILTAIHQLEAIGAERKLELAHRVKSATARFGDIAALQNRLGLLVNEASDSKFPHLIMDDDDI
ncbi:hypothetical protein ACA910_003111 [Epithemia clementina (nom. ined.)]